MLNTNIQTILATIDQSARKAKRNLNEIKLVAVSKKVNIEQIQKAIDYGLHIFGESYLQEAVPKIRHFSDQIKWHFIGHIQSNKAKQVAELFNVVETVGSYKVAKILDNHARALNKQLEILVQINIGKEQQKSGVPFEEAESLLRLLTKETNLHISGLMAIPPYNIDPEKSRPYYREIKKLATRLAIQRLFRNNDCVELSMGMSGDYSIAIEEGATIIRVGTAIFGERT